MTALKDTAGLALPDIESPSPERVRAYGDMLFLAFRSPRHSQMAVSQLRSYLEPPLLLGQFRLFRFDGVARGMYTWAWLSPQAEHKLVSGEQLGSEDWNSGKRLWIIDLIAPYKGLTSSMVRWIMTPGNFAGDEFLFRRVSDTNRTRRIVHINLRSRQKAAILSNEDFLKLD